MARDQSENGADDPAVPIEAGGAGRWILASRIIAQALQLGIFLLAARVLSPAEFGVFALVQAASVLLFVVASAGWRETIVSAAETRSEIDHIVTLALIGGLAMGAVAILGAAVLKHGAGEDQAAGLAVLFSVCVLLAPVSNAFNGMLVRKGRVGDVAAGNIAGELAGFAAAVAGLLRGDGVIALATGKVVQQAVAVAWLFWRAGWRPRLVLSTPRSPLLVAMSAQILANRSISFMQSSGATFIVGAFLGPASVGIYRAAERVVSSIAELVMEPLRMIAWVRLRRAKQAAGPGAQLTDQLASEAKAILPLFIMAAAPVFLGLSAVSRPVVEIVLGPAWIEAGAIVSVFSMSALIVVPVVLLEPLLSFNGNIRHLSGFLLLTTGISVGCLMLLGPFGLLAMASAGLVSSSFTLVAAAWFFRRHAGLSWQTALRDASPVLPPVIGMLAVVTLIGWLTRGMDLAPWMPLGLQVASGAAVYIAMLFAMRPDAARAIVRL